MADAESFARRHPGAFVAAAALAGFALARFARASSSGSDASSASGSGQYGGQYGDQYGSGSYGSSYGASSFKAGSSSGMGYGAGPVQGSAGHGASVSTRSMTTHGDEAGTSSVEAMPDDDVTGGDMLGGTGSATNVGVEKSPL